jgi:hypothetical protein
MYKGCHVTIFLLFRSSWVEGNQGSRDNQPHHSARRAIKVEEREESHELTEKRAWLVHPLGGEEPCHQRYHAQTDLA